MAQSFRKDCIKMINSKFKDKARRRLTDMNKKIVIMPIIAGIACAVAFGIKKLWYDRIY